LKPQIPWLRVFVEGVVIVGSILLVLLGCSGDNVPGESVVVRDSAGVRIVENLTPEWPGGSGWTVDSIPEIEIRGDFAEPEHYLFRAYYVVRMSDKRIVVGNRGTNEVFIFDSLGVFIRAEGGPGDGPGEFQRLFGLFRCEHDQLVVLELSRLSLLDREAKFLRTIRILAPPMPMSRNVDAISADCGAALFVSNLPRPPLTQGLNENRAMLLWAAFADGASDTIATFVGTRFYAWEERGELEGVEVPFSPRPAWATSRDDNIYLGLAQDFEVQVLGRDRGLVEVIRWSAEREPVTAQDWSDFLAEVQDYLREYPDERRFWPPLDDLPRSETKPAYARLLVDDEGLLWVQQFGIWGQYGPGPSADWWVFDATGRWFGSVTMPPGLQVVTIADGFVIGVFLDEFDVENIRLHRLTRGSVS